MIHHAGCQAPDHTATSSELQLFLLKWNIWNNLLEFPGDDKSFLVQSTEALMLIQHQQQMTLQMNICVPYWADSLVSFECRGPHMKGPSDSQSAKRALVHPYSAKIA